MSPDLYIGIPIIIFLLFLLFLVHLYISKVLNTNDEKIKKEICSYCVNGYVKTKHSFKPCSHCLGSKLIPPPIDNPV